MGTHKYTNTITKKDEGGQERTSTNYANKYKLVQSSGNKKHEQEKTASGNKYKQVQTSTN